MAGSESQDFIRICNGARKVVFYELEDIRKEFDDMHPDDGELPAVSTVGHCCPGLCFWQRSNGGAQVVCVENSLSHRHRHKHIREFLRGGEGSTNKCDVRLGAGSCKADRFRNIPCFFLGGGGGGGGLKVTVEGGEAQVRDGGSEAQGVEIAREF